MEAALSQAALRSLAVHFVTCHVAHHPGSWDSWTPGSWLSEFDCTVIFFLIISSEGKGELTYQYIFNLSEAKSTLFAMSLEND